MRLLIRLTRLIALSALAAAAAGCAAVPRAADHASGDPPVPGFSAQVQRHLAEREYWASENARGLQAPNRAHRLRTYFTADGIRVVDREDPASPELLGLRFDAWGREGALARAGKGGLSHANERIRRPGLVEWFVNGPEGLEHGLTVETRPEGDIPLVIALETEGARAHLSGDAVLLDTAAGRTLRYAKLAAWDANGAALEAHFAVPAPDRVQLVVADAGAVYPLTIDPLLTEVAGPQRQSNQESAGLGVSVSSAGDVNGDGYADVIVGAAGYDAGEVDEGAAFVFLGSVSGIGQGDTANAHAQLESDQAGAQLGASVSSAGDVNGDGFADVIAGARRYDAGETDEGAAFVFLGSASGIGDGHECARAARVGSSEDTSRRQRGLGWGRERRWLWRRDRRCTLLRR